MKFINVPNTLEVSLDSAAKFAQTLLTNLAVDQRFTQVITTAFEDEFNTETLERLRKAWANGDFSHLPEVEIRSSQEINCGAGAFSKNTNKIYLAEEFAVLHRNHTLAIADILLEETGHWVDAQINTEEAPGDEGAIFSALVRGKILDPHELQALKTENDHATVILDGEEIEIEQAIVEVSGEIVEVDISNFWADDATISSAFIYSDWWAKTNDFLQIFEETDNVFLQENLTISNPLDWDQLNNLDVIEAGLTVNSYFVFFKNPNPGNNVEVQATITFDENESIVGFMGDPDLINPTNDLFVPFVARDLSGNGTLDMSVKGLDTVEILGEGNVLEVTMKNTSAVDPLRIITYSTPAIPEPDPVLIEAEDMILRNYIAVDHSFASGGQLIRHRNNDREGKAITTWEGEAGVYDLTVIYHDESDGNGKAEVNIDGNLVENWILDENPGSPNPRNDNRVERTLTQPVNLYPGSRIQLSGWRDGGENTWFDAIQLTPTETNIVQVEAEDMVLDNYIIRDRIFASGEQLIRLRNNDRPGTATTTWTGEAGIYNIQVVYHDEDDGNAAAQLTVDGQLIDSWTFDDNPRGINPNKRNRIERVLEVPVTLAFGSEIEFTGWRDGGEHAWLDHIQFILVEPIENTNPEAQDNQYNVAEDNTLTISTTAGVLSNDTDADGDSLTVTAYDSTSTAGGTVNVNADGSFSYTPATDFAGNDSFNYAVSDDKGGVDTATVTIEVTAENDAPEAVDDSYSLVESTELTFDATRNDSDIDGDSLTINTYDTASLMGGTVSLNGDGSFTYVPAANFTGNDSFTYSITDGNGETDTATVNLTVNEVNTDTVRIEAENLTLDNYVERNGDFASGGKLITLGSNGDIGSASHTWNGLGGEYELTIAYFNESDGASNATVKVDGVEVDSWTWNLPSSGTRPNADNLEERTVNINLNSGSIIEVIGVRHTGENARLDYFEYTPILTEPDVTPPTASLEAETLTVGLDSNLNYNFTVNYSDNTGVDVSSLDSNDIQVTGPNGFSQTATLLNVAGNEATYQIQAPTNGWQEDNFGSYEVTVKSDEVSDIDGNFIAETLLGNFQVNVGETVSYALSDKAIIARLDQDFVFTPEFEDTLEIMLLGDSITQGKVNNAEPEEEREGYRRFLWDAFNDLGLDVDFVGSESNGKDGFDQDHQGHSGWTIQNLTYGKSNTPNSGIDNWISESQAQPDLILAMAGTNNAGSSGANIANRLDDLIEKIFNNPIFDGELMVSTIAPIHPNSIYYDSRLPNVIDYNALIPGVIESYTNQGEEIHFVDIWSGDYAITENDMTAPPADNGLHPSVNGYYNMAQTFYNAILDAVGVSESVNNVSNIIGSDLDDVIVGNNSSNEMVGGIGADELTGNDGADLFIYETANDGEDILTDFDSTEGDQIQISAAGFGGGLVAGVSLSDSLAAATGVFVSGLNPQPVGDSANFLYDSDSGILSVDIDGEGVENAVTLATLTGAPALAFNDLMIA